jgi:hypothetical protein
VDATVDLTSAVKTANRLVSSTANITAMIDLIAAHAIMDDRRDDTNIEGVVDVERSVSEELLTPLIMPMVAERRMISGVRSSSETDLSTSTTPSILVSSRLSSIIAWAAIRSIIAVIFAVLETNRFAVFTALVRSTVASTVRIVLEEMRSSSALSLAVSLDPTPQVL